MYVDSLETVPTAVLLSTAAVADFNARELRARRARAAGMLAIVLVCSALTLFAIPMAATAGDLPVPSPTIRSAMGFLLGLPVLVTAAIMIYTTASIYFLNRKLYLIRKELVRRGEE